MHAIELLGTRVAPIVKKELASAAKSLVTPKPALRQSVAVD
jgi:hypothetical protein